MSQEQTLLLFFAGMITPGKPMSVAAAVSADLEAGTASSTTGWTKNPSATSGTDAEHGRRPEANARRSSRPEEKATSGGPVSTTPPMTGGNPRSHLPPRPGRSTRPHTAAAVQARGSTRSTPVPAPPSESRPTPGGR